MAWTHCEQELSDDVLRCPECDADKAAWTLAFDVTRTFQVSRRQALRFSLVDSTGTGVADEAFCVLDDAGEQAAKGVTDEHGFAHAPCGAEGELTLTFPFREAHAVVKLPPPREADEGAQPEAAAPGSAGEPTFRVATGLRKHPFRLENACFLHLLLVDDLDDHVLSGVDYELRSTHDELFSCCGTTDAEGRLRWEALPDHGFVLLAEGCKERVEPRYVEDREEHGETAYVVRLRGHRCGEEAREEPVDAPAPADDEPRCLLHLQLVDDGDDHVLSDTDYVLRSCDGETERAGTTDGEGRLLLEQLPDRSYVLAACGAKERVEPFYEHDRDRVTETAYVVRLRGYVKEG